MLFRSPVVGEGDGRLTRNGVIAGTPAYMSPEQADGGEAVDARSDIYSLGAVAYFCLRGRPPFTHRSATRTLAAHLHEAPEPLTAHRPEVPADLEAVVLRCLAKEPSDRFPDVGALDRALGACPLPGGWSADEAAAWWRGRAGGTGAPAPGVPAERSGDIADIHGRTRWCVVKRPFSRPMRDRTGYGS